MKWTSRLGEILFAAALLLFCLAMPRPVHATGTLAGEKIENKGATAQYTDESLTAPYTSTSNTVLVTITEIYRAQLSCQSEQSANSSTDAIYWCKLTNTSNANNTFTLTLTVSDPKWTVKLLADDGAGTSQNGIHDTGENNVLTTPFTTPVLGADKDYWVFVSVTVPPGTVKGSTATFTLKAVGSGDSTVDGPDDKTASAMTTAKAPSLKLNKTVRNLNLAPDFKADVNAKPGDVLEYRIEVINEGDVAAGSVVLTDTLDSCFTLAEVDQTRSALYVGSVETDGPSNGTAKTTAPSGDPSCSTFACGTAQYNSETKIVTFYLGNGATESAGGQLGTAPNNKVYAFFRVTVN